MAHKKHPAKPNRHDHLHDHLHDHVDGHVLDPEAGQLIAITGGIGTGKTFALECFAGLGFIVFNADRAVHDMLMIDGIAYEEVTALFPEAVTRGAIDRKILSDVVFKDLAKLKALEAILHPKLRQVQDALIENVKKQHGKSVIFEVPLLFENQRHDHYDLVIVTTLSKSKQKERVLQRKNMTEEKFDAIIGQQVPNEVRLSGAHFVINTGKGKEDTLRQIKAIVKNESPKRDSTRHRNHRPIRKKR